MELKNKRICFLGDSITFGHGTTGPDGMFVHIVEKDAGLAEAFNYGICGTRIANQCSGEDNGGSFVQRFPTMTDSADAVVVFGGTNDYGHGDAPFGTMDDRSPFTFYGACHTLFSGLKAKYPDAVIAVMTPICRAMQDRPNAVTGRTLAEYAHAVSEIAGVYGLPVLDLFAEQIIVPDRPDHRELYCPDGLHPGDAGNRLLADRLMAFLKDC